MLPDFFARRVAAVPERIREEYLMEAKEKGKTPTAVQVVRLGRLHQPSALLVNGLAGLPPLLAELLGPRIRIGLVLGEVNSWQRNALLAKSHHEVGNSRSVCGACGFADGGFESEGIVIRQLVVKTFA